MILSSSSVSRSGRYIDWEPEAEEEPSDESEGVCCVVVALVVPGAAVASPGGWCW
jgi:hypothetical protein